MSNIIIGTTPPTAEELCFAVRPEIDFSSFRHFASAEADETVKPVTEFTLETHGLYVSAVAIGGKNVGFVALRNVVPAGSDTTETGAGNSKLGLRRSVRAQMWLQKPLRAQRISSTVRDMLTDSLWAEAEAVSATTGYSAKQVAAQTYIYFPGVQERGSSPGHRVQADNYGMQRVVDRNGLPAMRSPLSFLSAALEVRRTLEGRGILEKSAVIYPVLEALRESMRARDQLSK
jgi:hypothetical protein